MESCPDEQIHELERHMAGCPDCHTQREAMHALKVLAEAHPVPEPTPEPDCALAAAAGGGAGRDPPETLV